MRMLPTWMLVSIAGTLGAFGIAFSWIWPLAVVGLALFMYVLWNRSLSTLSVLGYGLLYGTLTGGAAIVWFLDGYPITRLGIINPFVGHFLVSSTWVLIALTLGSAVAVGAVALRQMRDVRALPLIAALLWVVIEQGRMWAFAGFTWAPQSFAGANFSVASIGYALAANPMLLQLAHPLGILALDFTAALFAATLACAPRLPNARTNVLLGATASLLLLSLPLLFPYRPEPATDSMHFSLITTNFQPEQTEFSGTLRTLLTEAAADPETDAIVFPEGYGLTHAFPGSDGLQESRPLFGDRDPLILTSSYKNEGRTDGPPGVQALRYLSPQRGLLAEYQKIFLIPVGEYQPLVFSAYYSLFDTPQFRKFLNYIGGRSSRGTDVVAYSHHGVQLGVLLCSDMIAPSLYRALAFDHGAQVLVNLSNHAWFHTSPRLYDKMLEIAKVTAVSTRRPLVVANNVAPSFALNEQGAFIASTPWHSVTVLPVTVPVRP